MIDRIKSFFSTFLLFELLKGMMLTGRYLFARKITVHFPEEKHLNPLGLEDYTRYVVTLTGKSAV